MQYVNGEKSQPKAKYYRLLPIAIDRDKSMLVCQWYNNCPHNCASLYLSKCPFDTILVVSMSMNPVIFLIFNVCFLPYITLPFSRVPHSHVHTPPFSGMHVHVSKQCFIALNESDENWWLTFRGEMNLKVNARTRVIPLPSTMRVQRSCTFHHFASSLHQNMGPPHQLVLSCWTFAEMEIKMAQLNVTVERIMKQWNIF